MLLLGCFTWLCAQQMSSLSFAFTGQSIAALALGLGGFALNLAPKLVFARAGTTVNPLKPETSSHLVTTGIYRYTRNPMYLGHAAILLGWVSYLGNAVGLFAVAAFILYVSRFQVQPEERHLSTLFPEQYAAYAKRTRRWL
jgi:protein-S-isoprenylcysteine O-methyltransferase Ste14